MNNPWRGSGCNFVVSYTPVQVIDLGLIPISPSSIKCTQKIINTNPRTNQVQSRRKNLE